MNANEIKAIIAEKIAGQGNQVDIGNGLAEVLNAIVDIMPSTTEIAREIRTLRGQISFVFESTDSIAQFNQANRTNFGSFEELKNYIEVRMSGSADWAVLRFKVGDEPGFYYLNYYSNVDEIMLLMGGYYGNDSGMGAIVFISDNDISVTTEEI